VEPRREGRRPAAGGSIPRPTGRGDPRWGGGSETSDASEFRIFFDFYSPSLVFGKVPVQGVEFVDGELIDEFFDVFGRKHVAADIEVHTTPLKAGVVVDCAGGKRFFSFKWNELEE